MADHESLVDLLWKRVLEDTYISRDAFAASLAGYDLEPVFAPDGDVAAIFCVNGPEFHFATFGKKVSATKQILRKYPGSLIEKYGYAITKTPKTDTRQQRFNDRLGFFKVGEDTYNIHYRIEVMKCQ